jgi:dephospho-CoA kinase
MEDDRLAEPRAKSQEPGAKPIVGLVGQVCAGKSTVADAFRRRGAQVYDADASVAEIYTRPAAIKEVRRLFGPGVIGAYGRVDRKALAKIVFADAAKLKALTSRIVFPRTAKAIAKEIRRFNASDARLLLLDAPTLFESGRKGLCSRIVFVAAPLKRRKAWAAARGWDRGELKRRESRMMNEAAKRAKADFIIHNSGPLAVVDKQVAVIVKALTQGS